MYLNLHFSKRKLNTLSFILHGANFV